VQALADYLRLEAARPFARGTADCVALVADWVALRRGSDPIAPWRGYATDAEADALLDRYGGLVRIAIVATKQAGLVETMTPRPGDVALIATDTVTRAIAIRTTKGWIVRLREGLSLYPPEQVRLLRAWRV
jgi:hypothetical protein